MRCSILHSRNLTLCHRLHVEQNRYRGKIVMPPMLPPRLMHRGVGFVSEWADNKDADEYYQQAYRYAHTSSDAR